MKMSVAVYPGSFDPITNGHLNMIKRGAALFDKLYIVISENINKKNFFTTDERVNLVKFAVAHLDNVEVIVSGNQLTVDLAEDLGATVILRGLRAVTDFEYEFTMAMTNAKLSTQVETVFLTADNEHMYLSSSMVKEVAKFGGNIKEFVPEQVVVAIDEKLKQLTQYPSVKSDD